MPRYGHSDDMQEFVIASGEGKWVLRMSINEVALLQDALKDFAALRQPALPPDEPTTIVLGQAMTNGYTHRDHIDTATGHLGRAVLAINGGRPDDARWALIHARQDITRALALLPPEDDRDAA
jgi:hypothetical protein